MRAEHWPHLEEAHHRREMRRLLDNPRDSAVFILNQGDKPVGFCEVTRRFGLNAFGGLPVASIDGFWLAKGMPVTGRRELVDEALEWAAERGCRRAVFFSSGADGEESPLGIASYARPADDRLHSDIIDISAIPDAGDATEPGRVSRPPVNVMAPEAPVPAIPEPVLSRPVTVYHEERRRPWLMPLIMAALGGFSFMNTNIWSGGVFEGVLAPALGVIVCIYFIYVGLRWRHGRYTSASAQDWERMMASEDNLTDTEDDLLDPARWSDESPADKDD